MLLAALGCALGLGIGFSDMLAASMPGSVVRDFFQQLRQLDITADVLLWVFLPILLFDTATKLDGRELLDDLGPILILAVVAVLMTTAAAGLSVWAVSSFSLTACLLVAAIIATTDPSAVTAVFREVGARRRLTLLVEGESLLNDAAAIALFDHATRPRRQPRPRGRGDGRLPHRRRTRRSISSAAPWSAPSWGGSRRSWSAASTKAARPR